MEGRNERRKERKKEGKTGEREGWKEGRGKIDKCPALESERKGRWNE